MKEGGRSGGMRGIPKWADDDMAVMERQPQMKRDTKIHQKRR